ncbi:MULTISPECIES: hypothetical protein [Xanthomonas]|uniref:hypothetical protein n=1 Tax=Xanthomonas TaxID=338 RepID=UPI001ADB2298|nr:hypothetical protein [Xanthomonas phaseoli]MBO9766511.1 hypothetical protein [Xanthomonas phaseoli pv. dieffenbachiae]MBO9776144.1 hypothetical protein [Xanthomonas phaseoli pv. dieffenbachiae]MBO9778258.1 hypothetical protein [Xanthomonas phaseoli pv. dieffenbachiae]MBO9795354.1 hypothetical protein [Xanthomonas phaseoli pv. dieffenbachiae]MBO9801451.1 hypothetical protein [Xanthomonas phaseoli pv. dieffenbachiae]
MQISNNHTSPLSLPDGTTLVPGSPATVPNWPTIKKNAVVQAWLAANVLSESKDNTEPFLLGTFNLPDSILLIEGGDSVTRDDVVQHAFKASALSLEDWNSLGEVDREARISASLDTLKAEAAAAAQAVIAAQTAADQRKLDLIAKLEAGGIKHDKRWGVDKLQAALDDHAKTTSGS